jgi:Arc/MetJ-type ribon-helix-helix transcriptional regulator
MSITLTPSQERAIEEAIRAGIIHSVDEFITTAIEALPRRKAEFDRDGAHRAGQRIRELRKGVRLERQGMPIREMAHIGHKY